MRSPSRWLESRCDRILFAFRPCHKSMESLVPLRLLSNMTSVWATHIIALSYGYFRLALAHLSSCPFCSFCKSISGPAVAYARCFFRFGGVLRASLFHQLVLAANDRLVNSTLLHLVTLHDTDDFLGNALRFGCFRSFRNCRVAMKQISNPRASSCVKRNHKIDIKNGILMDREPYCMNVLL